MLPGTYRKLSSTSGLLSVRLPWQHYDHVSDCADFHHASKGEKLVQTRQSHLRNVRSAHRVNGQDPWILHFG